MKRHTLLAAAAGLFAAFAAGGAELPFGTGLFINGTTFTPHAFDVEWHGFGAIGLPDADAPTGETGNYPKHLVRHFTLNTGMAADSSVFDGVAMFSETPEGAIQANWTVVTRKSGSFAEAFVGGDIPFSRIGGGMALIDGKGLPIPAEKGQARHLFRGNASSLELRTPDGAADLKVAFDEPTAILLQDGRHWNGDDLTLRFYFASGGAEAGREYAIRATIETPAVGPQTLTVADPVCISAGPDWLPLTQEPWIVPGSALDFSSVIPRHKPAGRFGRVVVRGDHFEFENLPGVPQRFYGVNVCGTANLPDTMDQAERFVSQLERIGYNTLRLHHHERWIVAEDGRLHDGLDNTMPCPELMDKFDMLVAACVKHGIYLTTDLYVSRSHVISWRSLGIDRDGTVSPNQYKILCAFWEPAITNLCAWSRNFMLHKNPYTGRSLAEEPALATLALVNEGNLGSFGTPSHGELQCVRDAWRQWLAAKRTNADDGTGFDWSSIPDTIPDGISSPDGSTPRYRHVAAYTIFLAEAEARLFERLRDFVRDELHCSAPLSNLSGWYEPAQYALPRSEFDYSDAHFYVDHPEFLGKPWQLPTYCPNVNPMLGEDSGVRNFVWKRTMGKPFCITEFNYSAPGRYRGVGGIATGALGALQDWCGIWRFAWSHSREGIVAPGGRIGSFDLANDPLSLAAERAALCLFLRRDLGTLGMEAPVLLDAGTLRDPRHGAPALASFGRNVDAWTRKVGTVFNGNWKRPNAIDAEGCRKESEAVSIDPSTGTFLLDTPCTAGGFAESGAHVAGPLRFALADAPATVWVSSLDGNPISKSSHLLLTHLTDVQNTGIQYADPKLTILLDWGRLPHLMRRGVAAIELALEEGDGSSPQDGATHAWRVWRLSPGGRRVGEVPSTVSLSGDASTSIARLCFTAHTDYDPSTATYLYEIVRE